MCSRCHAHTEVTVAITGVGWMCLACAAIVADQVKEATCLANR